MEKNRFPAIREQLLDRRGIRREEELEPQQDADFWPGLIKESFA